MNWNTTGYQEIPIPEELEETVAWAIRRGNRHRRRRLTGTLAALLAVMLVTANVPQLYAGAEGIPLLGQMVRVLRVGSGGQQTEDLLTASVLRTEGGAELHFVNEAGEATAVPPYSALHSTAPERLTLRFHGVEAAVAREVAEGLLGRPGVADAYPVACTAEGEQGVTLVLEPGMECIVGEYGEPSALGLQFAPAETAADTPVWYLRSEAVPFGEDLAALTEALQWEGAAQVRVGENAYLVTVGSYATQERAEAAADGLAEKTGIRLEAASGLAYEIPET